MAAVDSADRPPKAYLFLQDGERYFRFFFTKPRVLVGRSEDNDIVIRDEAILPRHAEIFVAGPDYQLIAVAGSYTELNDEKVQGVKTLQNGDEIQFGNIHLLYVEEHRTSETALNLIIQREGDIPFGVTINKPLVRVGRRHGDVLIDDDAISDTHLLIENFCEHGVFALDTRSERGTLLNGQPLDARRRIEDGDTIEIGTTHILVRIRRAGEARKPRKPSASRAKAPSAEQAADLSPKPPRQVVPVPPQPAPRPEPRAAAPRPEPHAAAPRPEPSFAISAGEAAVPEPSMAARARIRRTPDAAPEPAVAPRPARRPERPARAPERAEPEPAIVAEASDGRVRNTLRMPVPAADQVAAPPWQGRADSQHSSQSVVSIDGPVRPSGPEPLQRPPRRSASPPPPPPPPEAPRHSTRENGWEAAAEAPRRVARGDDDGYHYLPGGVAPKSTSRGDAADWDRGRTTPDRPERREATPDRAPSTRREDDSLDRAFKGGMTVAFPNADAAMVDDGSRSDEPRKYYHPDTTRRR